VGFVVSRATNGNGCAAPSVANAALLIAGSPAKRKLKMIARESGSEGGGSGALLEKRFSAQALGSRGEIPTVVLQIELKVSVLGSARRRGKGCPRRGIAQGRAVHVARDGHKLTRGRSERSRARRGPEVSGASGLEDEGAYYSGSGGRSVKG